MMRGSPTVLVIRPFVAAVDPIWTVGLAQFSMSKMLTPLRARRLLLVRR